MRSEVSQVRAGLVALVGASWLYLVYMAWGMANMDEPAAQLFMPAMMHWGAMDLVLVFVMWAIMMAAMMLPSALPMILTFVKLGTDAAGQARGRSFVVAYLLVWFVFSVAASAAQWLFQAMDWVSPMIVSTSSWLTVALLLIAGVYQFSPLKRVCLATCRTPLGFLLGEWRAGVYGAFMMGVRHGVVCLGCCWALMALLFVGGVMNLAWVVALSIAVAIEKLAPHGDRLARVLGLGLIAAGLFRLLAW